MKKILNNKIDSTTDRILQKLVPIIENEVERLELGGAEAPPNKQELIERLTIQLDRLYDISDHPEHFHTLMRRAGYNVYENRQGKVKGIYSHGRKIPFKKVGVSDSRYEALDRKFTRKKMDKAKKKPLSIVREGPEAYVSPFGPQRAIESTGKFIERRIADLEQIANNKLDDYELES